VALRLLGRDCHRCNSAVEGGVVRTRRVWQAPARRRCSAACGARHFSAAGRRRQAAVVPTADPLPSRLAWQEPDSPPRPARVLASAVISARGANPVADALRPPPTPTRSSPSTSTSWICATAAPKAAARQRGRRDRAADRHRPGCWLGCSGPPDRPGVCHRPARPHRAAPDDLDPATGRARRSYRRAAELIEQATVACPGGPWTLHQLRHSALTQAAQAGANTATLLA
jgi:hypothetical protein